LIEIKVKSQSAAETSRAEAKVDIPSQLVAEVTRMQQDGCSK
jgi:hypothetical protein